MNNIFMALDKSVNTVCCFGNLVMPTILLSFFLVLFILSSPFSGAPAWAWTHLPACHGSEQWQGMVCRRV